MASARAEERKRAMLAWAKAVFAAREAIPFEAFDALTEEDGWLLEAVERLALRADDDTPPSISVVAKAREVVSERGERDIRIAHALAIVEAHHDDADALVRRLASEVSPGFGLASYRQEAVSQLLSRYAKKPGRTPKDPAKQQKIGAPAILEELNKMARFPLGRADAHIFSSARTRAQKK